MAERDSIRPAGKSEPPPEPEDYLAHLNDIDITESEKIAFLSVLLNLTQSFVDFGFEVNSIPDYVPALAEISSYNSVDAVKSLLEIQSESTPKSPAAGGGQEEEEV